MRTTFCLPMYATASPGSRATFGYAESPSAASRRAAFSRVTRIPISSQDASSAPHSRAAWMYLRASPPPPTTTARSACPESRFRTGA